MLSTGTVGLQLFRISVFAPSHKGSQHRWSVRKRRKVVKPNSTLE